MGVWVGVLCACACVRVHMSLNVGMGECVSLDRSPCRPDQVSEGITLLIDAQSSKTHIPAKMLIESLAVSPSHSHTLPSLLSSHPLSSLSASSSFSDTLPPIPSHLKSPTPLSPLTDRESSHPSAPDLYSHEAVPLHPPQEHCHTRTGWQPACEYMFGSRVDVVSCPDPALSRGKGSGDFLVVLSQQS